MNCEKSDDRHMQRTRPKHGRRSYLSVGIGSDSQSLLEREPLRSKDRGLLSYRCHHEGQQQQVIIIIRQPKSNRWINVGPTSTDIYIKQYISRPTNHEITYCANQKTTLCQQCHHPSLPTTRQCYANCKPPLCQLSQRWTYHKLMLRQL